MLSRFQVFRFGRPGNFAPGAGIPIVFQQQMRSRCPWRDLIWTSVLVICHEAIAAGLQYSIMPAREYSGDTPGFLHRWLSMAALAGPLLYLPIAAVLGAVAAPPVSRFEETQSMLLTRLTPFDVCAGRLLSWLWPLISALLASCAISLTVQVIWRPLFPGSADGYAAIFVVHLILLASVLAIGAIGFLFAMRRRPGRVLARGTIAALLSAVLAVMGLFLCNPVIGRMENPTGLIYGLLVINPATASAAALRMDVLRVPWLYDRTVAHDFPFSYPPPLASCALFTGIAMAALALSAVRLRRAYR